MHIEILAEDSSSQHLLQHLMPRLIGSFGNPHSWRIHAYRGMGRIPRGLSISSDPSKRILLEQLPRILRGYAKTQSIDAVVVVLDADDHNCRVFLSELYQLAASCGASDLVLFRLAIEETEAWYLGDRDALLRAYPATRLRALDDYVQDSVCGTWERVAEAVHPGGIAGIRRAGWPSPGVIKHEWADRIGPRLDPDSNLSPSFGKLRDGLRRLVSRSNPTNRSP